MPWVAATNPAKTGRATSGRGTCLARQATTELFVLSTRRPKNKPQHGYSGDHEKEPKHGADYNMISEAKPLFPMSGGLSMMIDDDTDRRWPAGVVQVAERKARHGNFVAPHTVRGRSHPYSARSGQEQTTLSPVIYSGV